MGRLTKAFRRYRGGRMSWSQLEDFIANFPFKPVPPGPEDDPDLDEEERSDMALYLSDMEGYDEEEVEDTWIEVEEAMSDHLLTYTEFERLYHVAKEAEARKPPGSTDNP